MPVFLIGVGSILGLIYALWRIHLLIPIIIAVLVFGAFKLAPQSALVIGLKCAGLPDETTTCAEMARSGWTRGWIMQAYCAKEVDNHYIYTRSTPDLTVRSRFQPTGDWFHDWWEGGGGLPY